MRNLKLIDVEGKLIPVYAQKIRGEVWLHFHGQTFIYEEKNQGRAKKNNGKAALAGDLLAPMPGKVTKVLKNTGDQVKKGDVVIVMEAMKMEYTLKSEGHGRITAINCQVNELVSLGKVLAHIATVQGEA